MSTMNPDPYYNHPDDATKEEMRKAFLAADPEDQADYGSVAYRNIRNTSKFNGCIALAVASAKRMLESAANPPLYYVERPGYDGFVGLCQEIKDSTGIVVYLAEFNPNATADSVAKQATQIQLAVYQAVAPYVLGKVHETQSVLEEVIEEKKDLKEEKEGLEEEKEKALKELKKSKEVSIALHGKVTALEEKLDTSEQKLDAAEQKLDVAERKLDVAERKLDVAEHTIAELKKDNILEEVGAGFLESSAGLTISTKRKDGREITMQKHAPTPFHGVPQTPMGSYTAMGMGTPAPHHHHQYPYGPGTPYPYPMQTPFHPQPQPTMPPQGYATNPATSMPPSEPSAAPAPAPSMATPAQPTRRRPRLSPTASPNYEGLHHPEDFISSPLRRRDDDHSEHEDIDLPPAQY